MAGSPPCFQLRCSNACSVGPRWAPAGPLAFKGRPMMPSLRPPSLPPPLLPHPSIVPSPILFLSPPPRWISHNPPRDLPPFRLLFLLSLLSASYLWPSHLKNKDRLTHVTSMWDKYGLPVRLPRYFRSNLFVVTAAHLALLRRVIAAPRELWGMSTVYAVYSSKTMWIMSYWSALPR